MTRCLFRDVRNSFARRRSLAASKATGFDCRIGCLHWRDREQRLAAGAEAEGKVVWYTSLAGSSYKELAQGFEKKYPGVKDFPTHRIGRPAWIS